MGYNNGLIRATCDGDLGLGGPGEMGRSMWLELASGLSGGLSSSGGEGVLASRSGPESLWCGTGPATQLIMVGTHWDG